MKQEHEKKSFSFYFGWLKHFATLIKKLWYPLFLQSHMTFVYLQRNIVDNNKYSPRQVRATIVMQSQWLCNYSGTPGLCPDDKASWWFSIEREVRATRYKFCSNKIRQENSILIYMGTRKPNNILGRLPSLRGILSNITEQEHGQCGILSCDLINWETYEGSKPQTDSSFWYQQTS